MNYRKVEFGMEFAKGSICVWITSQHWFHNSLWNIGWYILYWMNILVLNKANIFYKKRRLFWIHYTPQFHVVCLQLVKGPSNFWTTALILEHFVESWLDDSSFAKLGRSILQKANAKALYSMVLCGILLYCRLLIEFV